MQTQFKRVLEAIQALQQGKMVILTDHPDRENEGDIIYPAHMITAEVINFMLKHCSGIICLPLLHKHAQRLGLKLMVPPHENSSHRGTPFTVSIEARKGVSTGVSAQDRATTILTAVNPNASEYDLVKPGHVYPLLAKEGGVFERPGHTEGSIDLMRLAGLQPAAVLCEVMNHDGSMARGTALIQFAEQHHLPMVSIDDVIAYRRYHEQLIEEEVTTMLPLAQYGQFEMRVIKEKYSCNEHIVLSKNIQQTQATLVRIHSACTTGDLFGSLRCDCHAQLHHALNRISQEGGVLIYSNQEGRGIGLFNKIKAYSLQEKGLDTIEANHQLGLPVDCREYYMSVAILRHLGINQVRLLTNNPHKINELNQSGHLSVSRESMPVFCNQHNKHYLETKKNKLQHYITFDIVPTAKGA